LIRAGAELFSGAADAAPPLNARISGVVGFICAVSFAGVFAFLLMAPGLLGFRAGRAGHLVGVPESIFATPSDEEISGHALGICGAPGRICGHVVEWVLNPLWVQLSQKTHAEFGIERLLSVCPRPPRLVASFLGLTKKQALPKP